jgi:hypothetical protein
LELVSTNLLGLTCFRKNSEGNLDRLQLTYNPVVGLLVPKQPQGSSRSLESGLATQRTCAHIRES